ncbi:MAG TPA: hypothetical protein PKE31_04880 [Pseudomonadota bacterium]|jgi:hypothetical protein|nr:hypothetical protein [Pseudomonadota bacterium]
MSMASTEELRAELCRISGLSQLLAPGVLRRALVDCGVTPENATARDFLKALPKLEARMRAYLLPDEVERRLLQMRRLIEKQAGGRI